MLVAFGLSLLLLSPSQPVHLALVQGQNGSQADPQLTVQLCEVRTGSVVQSTCGPTELSGDFSAVYVSVSGLGVNSSVVVSGSAGIPLPWTSAWNSQQASSCGAAVCENGFYKAMTDSSGTFSGYSYCSPTFDGFCSYSGQGAAAAPAAGEYTITVCTGGNCVTGSVTTTSTTTTTTTTSTKSTTASTSTSTTTTSRPMVLVAVSTIGASAGVAGSYVVLNASVSGAGATGQVQFGGTGPGGATFPHSYCILGNGWCTISVQLSVGSWTITATFNGVSSSPLMVNIPAITNPSNCFGNQAVNPNSGNNSYFFLYVANELDNTISQYAVNSAVANYGRPGGVLCSLGPPSVLPVGTFPSGLAFVPSGESIYGYLGWAAGSVRDAGTLLITTGSNCIEGPDVDGGDGHLLYAGAVAGTKPGACLAPRQYLDQPAGLAFLTYGGPPETVEYVLNQGNSTIALLASPYQVTQVKTLEQPTSIASFGYPNYCVFVDNQTAVEGYAASEVQKGTTLTYTLTGTTPVRGSGFSTILVNPSSDIQAGQVRVLYVLSSSQNRIYEFQFDYGCKLTSWESQPTGQDPIGMIDIGTTYLYVLNAGLGSQASISTYFMNNTLTLHHTGDGSLTPKGSPTPAGFDAVAIGTDVQSYNGKWPGDEYMFVADAGSQTIDEYGLPGSGFPQYIGAIPSGAGAIAFASGWGGCFYTACVVAYPEFNAMTLPDAVQGQYYSYTIPLGPSGLSPYSMMSIYSGSLPPGLTLHSNGTINGSPISPSLITPGPGGGGTTTTTGGSGGGSVAGTYTFAVEQSSGIVTLAGAFSIVVLPPGSSATSVVLSSTTQTSTTTASCGKSCNPPGLHGEWATSNETVNARAETRPLKLSSSLTVSWIEINTSPSGQKIGNVAYSDQVLQVEFDKPGLIALTLKSSLAPGAVYADGNLISASAENEISLASPGYYYNKTSGILTVFGDPSTLTFFYAGTQQSTTTSPSATSSATPAANQSNQTTSTQATPQPSSVGAWTLPIVSAVFVVVVVLGVALLWQRRRRTTPATGA